MSRILVIAPHPDDEVLGVGGTTLRHLDQGDEVHVVICTRGEESRFGADQVATVQKEARDVHAYLGLTGSHFLDLPAAMLDTVPGVYINQAVRSVLGKVKPDTIYVPHVGDVHRDHQLIFQAVMVCCRPVGTGHPTRILAYETVSETDWYAAPMTTAFVPNVFIDISAHLERMPRPGDVVEEQGCRATVQRVRKQRVLLVELLRVELPEPDEDKDDLS